MKRVVFVLALLALAGLAPAQDKPKDQPKAAPTISAEQQAQAKDVLTEQQMAAKDAEIAQLKGQVAQLKLALLASDLLKDKPGYTLRLNGGKLEYVAEEKPPAPKPEK